jgi:DNA polymerase
VGREADDALAALGWLVAMGADEAIGDAATDRSAVVARPPAPTRAVSPLAAARTRETPAAGQARALADAAATLPDLAEAIRRFDGLAIRETATSLVFADGVAGAPVMVIGEAPGGEEDQVGRPFVGKAGRLLDQMLASVGLCRAPVAGQVPVYIANILTWRPPGNRNPSDEEVALSLPFCWRHIALAQPRVLLLTGAVPTKALTGRSEGITRLRGRWFDLPVPGLAEPVPALATLHPAYLLRSPGAKRDAWADLLALRARLSGLGIVSG